MPLNWFTSHETDSVKFLPLVAAARCSRYKIAAGPKFSCVALSLKYYVDLRASMIKEGSTCYKVSYKGESKLDSAQFKVYQAKVYTM